ncbi:MAG: type I-U CRISPR-associated protein Cas5/Cas6 [Hyphomicrobiales bacterium]|nr:type I-U CRISPR-associated protein Cas5/Cas6 [Hyphomicrobiales bacterium]MBW0003080.1 type I-U CRISPR-associated protein Cas5/Cas6 [Hyphomicrobiales bacterium]
MASLLISVQFHDGSYHGSGEWPPSPARFFQALVAGAARGATLPGPMAESLRWLEGLAPPEIAAPPALAGRGYKTFVPNNDLDAVGGDPARVGEVRTGKIIRPRFFDPATSLVYAWTFEPGADADQHAQVICEIADRLYQLGRGVDMAWAKGEILAERETNARLRQHGRISWHPSEHSSGEALSSPHPGSLASLVARFEKTRGRFKRVGEGKKSRLLFSQAPKPSFRQVPYNSPAVFLLYDIVKFGAERSGAFAPQALARIVALTETIRDRAAERLKKALPNSAPVIDRVFIARDATEADKARRIRITPLPSIGHAKTQRSVRRVLVTVPPDCPIAAEDIAWAFSGLALDFDPKTGEVPEGGAELVPSEERTMLAHYGIGDVAPARLWRSVTPVALSERAARRRIDPRRMREEAKGATERLREHAAAEAALRQALRHAGIDTPLQAIRVQREPFEAKGERAEAFAPGTRFAKERLWHVELAFTKPVPGPLLIGDGRYLGLGLMAPDRRGEGAFAFAIIGGLTAEDHLALTRALRRAVMSRVQAKIGERKELPAFFTGHAADGAPSRLGGHEHLAFVSDAPRKRLLIVAPHLLERRQASKGERENLQLLDEALDGFYELRAGAAGRLALAPGTFDLSDDPLFAASSSWESLTPYRVTRHAKLNDAAAALEADLLAECRRAGLPRPRIEVIKTSAKSGAGLFGLARLIFHSATGGPILLGRDRHFGGGLFAAAKFPHSAG